MNYPKFETLNIAPDYLTFGAGAMSALVRYGWVGSPLVRELTPEQRRDYDRRTRKHWAGRKKMSGKRVA